MDWKVLNGQMVKRNDIKEERGTIKFHFIYLVKHLGNRIARGLRFYIILAGCWLGVTSQEIFLDEVDHSLYLALNSRNGSVKILLVINEGTEVKSKILIIKNV